MLLSLLLSYGSFFAVSAESENVVSNGRPISSLSGWSTPSPIFVSLGFISGSSSYLYAVPTASGRTTGIQLDYSDFTLMSDIMYNFELDIELFYFAQNSTIEISIISSDSQNSIFNRTFTVNPSGSSIRNKYTLEFACPVSGSYSFSVYSFSAGFGNYIPSYGGVRIYDLYIEKEKSDETKAIEKQTEEQKGMFEKLLQGIKDFFTGLFLPSDEFFDNYLNEWNDWMGERFGALYFPFEVLFKFLNRLLTFTPPENPTIVWPEIVLPMPDAVHEDVKIMDRMSFTFDFLTTQPWQMLYGLYKSMIWCIFGYNLVKLCQTKLDAIMSGG